MCDLYVKTKPNQTTNKNSGICKIKYITVEICHTLDEEKQLMHIFNAIPVKISVTFSF